MTNEQLKQILETLNNVSSHTLELYTQRAFVEGVIGTSIGVILVAIAGFCAWRAAKVYRDYAGEGWVIGFIVSGMLGIIAISCCLMGLFVPEAIGLDDFLKRVF